MPTTSDGELVYAAPAEVERYVQTQPSNLGLATTGSPSEWRLFLEARQEDAKARIDSFCDRDFEDHPGDTVTLDGGDGSKRILRIPSPVQSVTEVRVDGTLLSEGDYVVKDSGQLLRDYGNPHLFQERRRFSDRRRKPTWLRGISNIDVSLDWGYETPPSEISEAEKKLVDHTLVGLTQKREGLFIEENDISVSVNIPTAMNSEIRNMLSRHERNEVFI